MVGSVIAVEKSCIGFPAIGVVGAIDCPAGFQVRLLEVQVRNALDAGVAILPPDHTIVLCKAPV